MNTGLKAGLGWARNMRLDPFHTADGRYAWKNVATIDWRGMNGGAVLRRWRCAGGGDEDGNVTVTLELLHSDPMLSVPLLVADDLDDIAAI